MIHIDADACNDSRWMGGRLELGENTRALFGLDQHVVGPAQVARQARIFEDRFLHREAQRKRHHRQRRRRVLATQNDRDVEAPAWLGMPGSSLTSLSIGLLFSAHYGAGWRARRGQLAGFGHLRRHHLVPLDAAVW